MVWQPQHRQVEALAIEGPSLDEHVGRLPPETKYLSHVLHHPRIGRGRGGEDRGAGGELRQERPEPPVVGSEIVPPVRNAVRFVHHEQAARFGQSRKHLVPEFGIVESLGGQEEHIDLTPFDEPVDLVPLFGVRRVDRGSMDARPFCGRDLVPHEGQEGGDDDGWSGSASTEERRGDEVHGRLAPAGPLDDQRPSVSDDEGIDCIPRVLPQTGVIPRQCAKELLGLRAKIRAVCDAHRGNRTPEVCRRIGRAPGFTIRPRRQGSPRRRRADRNQTPCIHPLSAPVPCAVPKALCCPIGPVTAICGRARLPVQRRGPHTMKPSSLGGRSWIQCRKRGSGLSRWWPTLTTSSTGWPAPSPASPARASRSPTSWSPAVRPASTGWLPACAVRFAGRSSDGAPPPSVSTMWSSSATPTARSSTASVCAATSPVPSVASDPRWSSA